MAATGITSRAVMGQFFYTLRNVQRRSWVRDISMLFLSDQASETYNWLGQTSPLGLWLGDRNVKGLRENGITVKNLLFESTLEVDVREARRDKSGQIQARINDLAARAVQHWMQLLSSLIVTGNASNCYDGQFFFDTDHTEGENTTSQDNDLSVDISALPVSQHGDPTDPSVDEMERTIFKAIKAILGFLDDKSEPMNDMAESFGIMVPINYVDVAAAAVGTSTLSEGKANALAQSGLDLTVWNNPRLTDDDVLYVFRRDGMVKPFIRQAEVDAPQGGVAGSDRQEDLDVKMSALATGSEEEFHRHRHLYGVESSRNVAYGYWQHACRAQLV